MNQLLISRILVCIGLAVGLFNSWTIFLHIGDPNYVLSGTATVSASHPWFHNFRELIGDLASTVIVFLVFFGPERFRTPESWVLVTIVMIGYYAGFWIGIPFMPELGSESWTSELTHVVMAVPPLVAIFFARKQFKRDKT